MINSGDKLKVKIEDIGQIETSQKPKFNDESDIQSFKTEFEQLLQGMIIPIAPQQEPIQYEMFSDKDTENYSYDTKTIEDVDAMFFLQLSNRGESINIQMNDETSIMDVDGYKAMNVSKTLGNLLFQAQENNKTLRLDFDNHVTVVLKVSSEGKIDASFIPQNKEVERYLKNNIDYLKVRFDEQSIAYSNISYKPYNNNRQRQNKRQGDKNE